MSLMNKDKGPMTIAIERFQADVKLSANELVIALCRTLDAYVESGEIEVEDFFVGLERNALLARKEQ